MNRQQRRRQARRKGTARPRGPGAAQRMKEHQLGIEIEGFSKPMLDAMNVVAKERYKVGIGVVVQEEQRAKQVVESFDGDGWRRRLSVGRRVALRHARGELRWWGDRLREIAEAVADLHVER